MNSTRRLLALATLLGAARAMGQGVIEVRARAAIEPGAGVRLRDVAALSGDALELGDARVADGAGKITIEQVRAALDRDGRASWDRLVLRGRPCLVRVAGEPTAPRADEPAALEFLLASGLVGDGTVRGLVAQTLARELGVDPADLRCAFDPADREALSREVGGDGASLETRSLASGDSRPVLISRYTPGGAIETRTARVRVEVRRVAATASRDVPRGRVLSGDDVSIGERWIAPSAAPAATEAVVGAMVQQRLEAGELVEAGDVARPFVIKKGDIVRATCVRGGFAVEARARASGPARDGEELTLQSLDRKTTFRGRASGVGRVVVIDPPSDEEATRHEVRP